MGPVDEGLRRDAHGGYDPFHLVEGQLPRQHEAVKARVLQEPRPVGVVHRGLGGGRPVDAGVFPAEQLQGRHVLQYDPVRPGGGDAVGLGLQGGQLPVQDHGVHGDVELHTPLPAVPGGGEKLLLAEVRGAAPGVEALPAEIHGVRAAPHRGEKLLLPAHRGQDLRSCHAQVPPPVTFIL